MRLSALALLPAALSAAAAATSNPSGAHVHKRCTPPRNPDLPHGYVPPAPCWQTFDSACQAHLLEGTEMTLDAKHGTALVYGVSEYCAGEIAEELRRAAAGEANYGWTEKHGTLTVVEPRTEGGRRLLVISEMKAEVVERYENLTYMK